MIQQQAVCTIKSWGQATNLTWLQRIGLQSRNAVGPKFNEIVTIESVTWSPLGFMLVLKEYQQILNGKRNAYMADAFQPIISTFELDEQLNEIFHKHED